MKRIPKKKQSDLLNLSRKSIVNQLKSLKDGVVNKPPNNNMHGLVDENKWTWLLKCLAQLGNKRYPYQCYAKPDVNNGIFPMVQNENGPVTIALLSDWASDTEESIRIAHLTGQQDYSIHLGDTYYVGNSQEISDNFNDRFGGAWPYGTRGSFAMLGNHEMYSGGKSFFTELLPYMGVHFPGRKFLRQEASFFCLENDYWRIIGLDTGYDSLKGWLGLSPKRDLNLHDSQLNWLRDIVQPGKDNRGIILLSHHQCFSAFEELEFRAIIPQLAPLLRPNCNVLWFSGHEHRLAFYGYNPMEGTTGCYSRCIGHGGMPVEIQKNNPKSADVQDPSNRNLVMYDKRERETIDENIALGHNGYAVLQLDGPGLKILYYDDSFVDQEGVRSPIVEEKWTVDLISGELAGQYVKDNTFTNELLKTQADRLTHFQMNIQLVIT